MVCIQIFLKKMMDSNKGVGPEIDHFLGSLDIVYMEARRCVEWDSKGILA